MPILIPSIKCEAIFPFKPPTMREFGSYVIDMIKGWELGSFFYNASMRTSFNLQLCIEYIHNPPILPKNKRTLKVLLILTPLKNTSREDSFLLGDSLL